MGDGTRNTRKWGPIRSIHCKMERKCSLYKASFIVQFCLSMSSLPLSLPQSEKDKVESEGKPVKKSKTERKKVPVFYSTILCRLFCRLFSYPSPFVPETILLFFSGHLTLSNENNRKPERKRDCKGEREREQRVKGCLLFYLAINFNKRSVSQILHSFFRPRFLLRLSLSLSALIFFSLSLTICLFLYQLLF